MNFSMRMNLYQLQKCCPLEYVCIECMGWVGRYPDPLCLLEGIFIKVTTLCMYRGKPNECMGRAGRYPEPTNKMKGACYVTMSHASPRHFFKRS